MIDDIFSSFYKESKELLSELNALAGQLKGVTIPDEHHMKILMQMLQRLHRLIGGLASIGFSMFSPISRKTSLLAERARTLHGASISDLMKHITVVLTELSVFFITKERLREIEVKAPEIDRRIEACMPYVSVNRLQITTQDEVDDIMKMFGKV